MSENAFPVRGARSVCGTLNNPSDDEISALLNCGYAQYVCGATEIAPSTGTVHWQFYMYFKNCIRLSTLKHLCVRAAFFACKGNAQQNIDYVLKQRVEDVEAGYDNTYNKQTFIERGVRPNTEDRLKGVLDDCCSLLLFLSSTMEHSQCLTCCECPGMVAMGFLENVVDDVIDIAPPPATLVAVPDELYQSGCGDCDRSNCTGNCGSDDEHPPGGDDSFEGVFDLSME